MTEDRGQLTEKSNAQLLAAVPDYFAVGGLLKATPVEEGGRRLLYFQASNEDPDYQNEIVLAQALADSADYYLRHGNVDLSHYSILGAKSGLPNFMEYEIGKPVDVQLTEGKTFVKAELYQGDSPMAKNANLVWDSLTRQTPPSRWYPSVGGVVLSKTVKTDPATGQKVAVVDKVRWNNVALDRCPVNKTVPEASAAPMGVFAKSLNGFVVKALETGYGTDSSLLEGGAALRLETLHDQPYSYYQNQIAKQLRLKKIKPTDIDDYAYQQWGFTPDESRQFTRQFFTDLHHGVHQ